MKRKIIGMIVCMLMIVATVVPAAGMVTNEISETNNSNKTDNMNGNYNLVQQLNPTRKLFPRIYSSGAVATLDAYVINEGPDESSNYTLQFKWTRIFGSPSGTLLDYEIGEYKPLKPGHGQHLYLNFECGISGIFINVYKAQIINTAADLNPNDNIASFIYVVIGF